MGVPSLINNPTNETVRDLIVSLGYDLNPMKSVPGEFYTTDRMNDLKTLIREILYERSNS